jgi:hypothetical protein
MAQYFGQVVAQVGPTLDTILSSAGGNTGTHHDTLKLLASLDF